MNYMENTEKNKTKHTSVLCGSLSVLRAVAGTGHDALPKQGSDVLFPLPYPQALPPRSAGRGPSHHPLQHGRVRQRLRPPAAPGQQHGPRQCGGAQSLEGVGGPRRPPLQAQQVLHGPELGLGPLPAAAHAALPVPVGRGELPAVAVHRALLLPPLSAAAVPLHRLLLTRAAAHVGVASNKPSQWVKLLERDFWCWDSEHNQKRTRRILCYRKVQKIEH